MKRQNRLSAPGWRRCGSTVCSPAIARVQLNLQVLSADTRPPSCATRVCCACVEQTACVAVKYLALRIGREMGAHCAPLRKKKILCRSPYSLSSANFAVLSQKETGFKRVETLVSILLPTAVGTANSCAPQSATLRLIKAQKIPQRKPLRDLLCYFSKRFARSYASGAYRSCRRFR